MQNGIIVPLSGAFISGAIGPAATDTQLDISAMVWVANGTPSLAATGGSGTGAVATVTITGGTTAATTLTFTAGTGYKVGDVLTITQAGGANFTGSITLTVLEEDLLGDETEGYIMRPLAGQWTNVMKPSILDSFNKAYICQIESEHERKWEITYTGGSPANATAVTVAINKAMVKALQKPQQDVTLTGLPDGIAVSSVKLT
jgi:hypothetical protein